MNRLLEESAAALEAYAAVLAERRLKFEEARQISDLLAALGCIHHAEFPLATRPIAPPLPPIDEAAIVDRHLEAAKKSTSRFDRAARTEATQRAQQAAGEEIARFQQHYQGERQRWQEQADAWWAAMVSNEPTTVLAALAQAFEDNDAAAAAVGLDGDEVTLLVVVPDKNYIPRTHPTYLDADTEWASMEPLPDDDRAALYLALVAGYMLVTVKEAFAVAPAIESARIIAVRAGFRGDSGNREPEVLVATQYERSALTDVSWRDEDALEIQYYNSGEIVYNPAGPYNDLRPIDLQDEPDLAAMTSIVTFVDDEPLFANPMPVDGGIDFIAPAPPLGSLPNHGHEILHRAAQDAQQVLERGATLAEEIARGEWDQELSSDEAADVAASLAETAEVVRAMRIAPGTANLKASPDTQWRGLLPLNRKERFYTGTVFPGLVASTGFWQIQRLLDLFGVPATPQVGELSQIQFLTEYGFAESVYTQEDKDKWGSAFTRETPDIVLVGPDWLLAIEAKMYHSPSAASLNEQMAAQAPIVEHWRTVLELSAESVVHALLLPERLAHRERDGLQSQRVVTWEAVLGAFRNVAPPYWVSVLAEALERHEELESRAMIMPNAQAVMTGADIVEDAKSSSPTVGFIGRVGGVAGAKFVADVETGGWQTQKYQVRAQPVAAQNPNWMPVAAFLDAVESSIYPTAGPARPPRGGAN